MSGLCQLCLNGPLPKRRMSEPTRAAPLPCPTEPHWCQNPENPNGYSMHVPAGPFRHDPYAAQRARSTEATINDKEQPHV